MPGIRRAQLQQSSFTMNLNIQAPSLTRLLPSPDTTTPTMESLRKTAASALAAHQSPKHINEEGASARKEKENSKKRIERQRYERKVKQRRMKEQKEHKTKSSPHYVCLSLLFFLSMVLLFFVHFIFQFPLPIRNATYPLLLLILLLVFTLVLA